MRRPSREGKDRELKALPTVKTVERAIGLSADVWVDRCHEIACAVLEARLVVGVERYGHYYGPVAEVHPRRRYPFQRHGWIETPNRQVVDPTRWCFEMVSPYIYCGPGNDYDPGGQRMRVALRCPYPDGPHDSATDSPHLTKSQIAFKVKIIQLDVGGPARDYLAMLTDGQVADFSLDQVFWLANLPLSWLGEHAPAIYRAIVTAGHEAAIPIDNWRMVMDEPMASNLP